MRIHDRYSLHDTYVVDFLLHKKAHITAIVSRSDLVATSLRSHNLLMAHVIYHGGVTNAPTSLYYDTSNQEVETGDEEYGGKHKINGP